MKKKKATTSTEKWRADKIKTVISGGGGGSRRGGFVKILKERAQQVRRVGKGRGPRLCPCIILYLEVGDELHDHERVSVTELLYGVEQAVVDLDDVGAKLLGDQLLHLLGRGPVDLEERYVVELGQGLSTAGRTNQRASHHSAADKRHQASRTWGRMKERVGDRGAGDRGETGIKRRGTVRGIFPLVSPREAASEETQNTTSKGGSVDGCHTTTTLTTDQITNQDEKQESKVK